MPPRRVAARKAASAPAAPKLSAAKSKGRGRCRMSTDETTQGEIPVEVTANTGDTSRTEAREAEGAVVTRGVIASMNRDKLIDIADEVYHAHDEDEDEMEEEWENSFDVPRSHKHSPHSTHGPLATHSAHSLSPLSPRLAVSVSHFAVSIDFYFTGNTTDLQRTLVYRTALLFSTAPPSAPLHVDEYVEEWVDRCNVGITGIGGPLTMEEETKYHFDQHMAREEMRAAGGEEDASEGEAEGEEGEEEEVEEESERKPYMLVFPTAKRVIDFIAYLGTDGLYNIWMRSGDEGEEAADEEEYEPKTRLWWRMNESEWIPAYC